MKLSDIEEAAMLHSALQDLQRQIELIESGVSLGVTIEGRYQDDKFVDFVRPKAVEGLKVRKAIILNNLQKLGVEQE